MEYFLVDFPEKWILSLGQTALFCPGLSLARVLNKIRIIKPELVTNSGEKEVVQKSVTSFLCVDEGPCHPNRITSVLTASLLGSNEVVVKTGLVSLSKHWYFLFWHLSMLVLFVFIFKVVYVTATFPYIVLLVLLILGLTLEGHQEGIRFFVTPRWEPLANPQVSNAVAVAKHRR